MRICDVLPNFKTYVKLREAFLPKNVTQIIVFGSYARGEQRVSSDLDIAVVSDRPLNSQERGLVWETVEGFDDFLEISIFWTSSNKIQDASIDCKKLSTCANIKKEGVVIWEKEPILI